MTVAIVGGGLMGVHLAHYLSKRGLAVEVFEGSPELGGLAGSMRLPDGTLVDRYYHTVLSSDSHLLSLFEELGLKEQYRSRETKMGFYYHGRIHSMNNTVEFLRFPPLGWIDRFRLGLTVLYAPFVHDWKKLESVGVEQWLVRLSGRTTFDNIWRPLLRAKFDGGFERTPATYIWSRLVRMKSTRQGANQKEMAGHLIGGYSTLVKRMAERVEQAGGVFHLSQPVQEVVVDGEHKVVRGLRINGAERPFEAVIVTMASPIFRRLIPAAPADYLDLLDKTEYLGIICPLMVLDRPLTGYWTVNITDEAIPFTGVIEVTSYIDPQYVGGHHLVFLPKYTAPGSAWLKKSDDEIREIWLSNLRTMFPQFDPSWVRYFLVHRERYVEPLHRLNETDVIPPLKTPVARLYLANTAQIYPALTNGESVSRYAESAAQTVAAESAAARRQP
jgi:protoporphyrinogen oxidase